MADNNKLSLVVEIDVNKANASIKTVNVSLSSIEQAAANAERQNELTRRIQQKLVDAGTKQERKDPVAAVPPPAPPTLEAPPSLADTVQMTSVVQ